MWLQWIAPLAAVALHPAAVARPQAAQQTLPAAALTREQFETLMARIAEGWSRQDVELALSAFAPDAVYMEPPDIQLYVGHTQLRPYFAAVEPGTRMVWHSLWFDPERQAGAGEFTFGSPGDATHGVALVELRNGRIALWHEYQRAGPVERKDFLARGGKRWKWTIENYP
jgi:hypothetical protein